MTVLVACVQLFATLWTVACQASPSLGFSRQEHWSGLPFPSPVHESEKWKWSRSVMCDSSVWLFATPWTAAYQAPLSMGFSRQEYYSGLPLPSPRFSAIPIKLPMVFFIQLEQKKVLICMETQKTLNSQSNLEQEEWSWRNQPSWLQTILQNYSHQKRTVPAQKQV